MNGLKGGDGFKGRPTLLFVFLELRHKENILHICAYNTLGRLITPPNDLKIFLI